MKIPNLNKTTFWSRVLIVILFILTTLLVLLSSLIITHIPKASANTASSDLNVSIESTIYLSLANCDSSDPSSININIDPSPTGTFKSACQNITVTTNTPGYSLLAKASGTHTSINSGNPTNALIYQNPTTITPIPTISSTNTTNTLTNPATLSNNTWGFAMKQQTGMSNTNFDTTYTINDSTNKYANLPTTDTELYSTTTFPAPLTEFTSYYGTKINYDTLAGTYQTTITYTALGGEPEALPTYPKIGNNVYFQEMTTKESESCSALPIYDSSNPDPASTVTMIDNRNNQEYNVRRLQDGKCWMIDNLKLELTNGMKFTPADTNVSKDTTVYFTQDGTSTGTTLSGMDGNFTTSGSMTRDGTTSNTSPNLDAWRQADPSNTENCLNNTGTITANTYSPDSKTKCGLLYNYYTAIAGSRTQNDAAGYASSSICPAGWRLPYNTSVNDFLVLNNSMKVSTNTLPQNNWLPSGSFQGTLSSYYQSGLQTQGHYAMYWSSRVYSSTNAYFLDFFYNGVDVSRWSLTKDYGFAIRCML